MKKPAHYYNEMYKENFYFCIGWKPSDFEKYILKNYNYEIDCALCDGKTIEWTSDKGSGQIIWVRYKAGIKYYSTLCHELIHASFHILDRRGVRLTADNHEPLNYLVELLMRKAKQL